MKLLILFLFSSNVFATYFNDSFVIAIEQSLDRARIDHNFLHAEDGITEKRIQDILNDSQARINPTFHIPDYYKDSAHFWFRIYTLYTSSHIVLHDKNNLSVIYSVLDFSHLKNSSLNTFTQYNLQAQLSHEYINSLKSEIKKLSHNPVPQNDIQTKVYTAVKRSSLSMPTNTLDQKKLFKSLYMNLRTQTGQKDMIWNGIVNSIPYIDFLEKTISEFKLPKELLAIPFLESSFNYTAESKAAAVGLWQFMPYISNAFMPKISSTIDYRYNPIISSIAAFHLLKQNYQILKSWDLAVTAYNSGTKHIQIAQKKFNKNINLEFILKNYQTAHLGFAAKNFYSEFLALIYSLAYRDALFPITGLKPSRSVNYKIFLNNCKIKPKLLFQGAWSDYTELNPHFLKPNQIYNRGHLLVTTMSEVPKGFTLLPENFYLKYSPKFWMSIIKIKPCNF
jgi:membrane-bound lytic murein transglycosylase D